MDRIFCLFFLALVHQASVCAGENILCSEEFCQAFVEKNDCILMNAACHVQNTTLHGELFPSAAPCSCCNVCLQHLEKGDYCTIGSPDMPPPLLACGPHFTCKESENEGIHTCQEMDTPCLEEQRTFDKKHKNGEIAPYEYRPNCDGNGKYGPIKCNAFTCFCVDEDGNRIFGEAKRTINNEHMMKCECSRFYTKVLKVSKFLDIFPISRCLEDGSFDPMQCIDKNCFCVERETGSPYDRIYNTSGNYYSDIPCFNSSIHRSNMYLHDCEDFQWKLLDEITQTEKDGFTPIEIAMPKCQPDGWFYPVGKNGTKEICVDKYNRLIGKYSGPKDPKRTCNCARTEYILRYNKVKVLPKCTENGEYEKIQYKDDKCYCVDKDGLSTGKWKTSEECKLLKCD